MKRRLDWVALFLALASFVPGFAHAQETTSGSLTGEIVDAQGAAVPGATVSVTSDQGTKTFISDANGRFFAPFLTPGVYSVKVELSGFSPVEQKGIQVRLGQRLALSNLVLKVGGLEEVVEVVGTAPVVDTNSTTAGGVLDSEMMSRLPVGRNFTATLYLVPGVSDSSGVGSSNPSIGGASGLENNYVVDGVNITDSGFGGVGTFNPIFGSLGTGVTTDFIKETQVKTAGFEAEYGQATGGVVNVVTKSGTNNFSGSVFGYARPGALEGEWDELDSPNGTVNTEERNEYDLGAAIGGPLVKDKVFFFGTFNPQFLNRTYVAPNPSTGAGPTVVFPYAAQGGVEQKRKNMSYAGKVTWQANANHRFDVAAFGDPSEGEMGLQRNFVLRRVAYPGSVGSTALEGGFSEIKYGGHNQTIRYDGILSPSWLIEASVAHASNKFEETPFLDEPIFTDLRSAALRVPGAAITNAAALPTGTTGGLGAYEESEGSNLQMALKSTHIFNAAGNHQVRYGVMFEDIEFLRDTQYSGAGAILADGRTTVTGMPMQIRNTGANTYYRATRGKVAGGNFTTQKYTSFFVQDTWQATDKLTIRPGLRYERQHLVGAEPGVDGAPELCFTGDDEPNDLDPTDAYANEGSGNGQVRTCEWTWSDNWAPRLGLTYDIKGDGRSKVYAAWGRFYAKIPNDLAARALSSDAGITRQNYVDAGRTQPIPNGPVSPITGSGTNLIPTSDHAASIDRQAGSTYQDEIVAGLEFEVGRGVGLGARFIRRDMPQILEDIGQLPLAGYFLDECGGESVEYFITNVTAATGSIQCPGPNGFEDTVHKYNAFEFTLNKAFADNWSLMASYRYSQLEGNFEGFFRSDNGQTDPAISSLFDFPTNDPTYLEYASVHGGRGDIRYQGTTLGQGVLPNDRPHQVKVYGNYTMGALNLGLGFNWGSGTSLTPLAGNTAYANAGEIPEALRGSGIQTIDGFLERANADMQFDLHADYTIKFGDAQRVMLIADVFNLLDNQDATNYDNFTEITAGALNPNFGQPTAGGGVSTPGFAPPRSIRLGARFEF